jgi:hypothetical protein
MGSETWLPLGLIAYNRGRPASPPKIVSTSPDWRITSSVYSCFEGAGGVSVASFNGVFAGATLWRTLAGSIPHAPVNS